MKTKTNLGIAGFASSGKTRSIRAWIWSEWNRENPDGQISWEEFISSFQDERAEQSQSVSPPEQTARQGEVEGDSNPAQP